jgi:hypothetical protein
MTRRSALLDMVTAAVAALAVSAQAARADLFDDARREAELYASRSSTSDGSGVRLLTVESDNRTADRPPAQPARDVPNLYVHDPGNYNPNALSADLSLPRESQPWGWSWFPFYQCSLVYWRPTQTGGVDLSPLEKLDTYAYNRGNEQAWASAFEGCDTRPWIAQQRGLPSGHNLTQAFMEAGNRTTIPWQQNGQNSTIDVSWWGHCNGWAAAAVSFPESQLPARWVSLDRGAVRFLVRPDFSQPGRIPGSRGGGLAGLYQSSGAGARQMYMYAEDIKSILTEYGMQLRPNPAFSAGRRYDAPSVDVEEYFFERRPDGSVIIPTDAQMMWVALVFDGRTVGGWMIPRGVPERDLQNWRIQVEQYYRYYYPRNQIHTLAVVRYTNLPLAPTEADLRDMPPLVRKGYLDVDPLDFHDKATAAFTGRGGRAHSLIAEVTSGTQIWNFPMRGYSYNISSIQEAAYNAQARYNGGNGNDPSVLLNLARVSPTRLTQRGGTPVIRYRLGTMRVTLQKFGSQYDEVYRFMGFYGEGDARIGSCWMGESLVKHPDFVWYPDLDSPSVPEAGNPYVKAADLKALLPDLPIR